MDRHAADYDRYHAGPDPDDEPTITRARAADPGDDTSTTIHRDVDGDGLTVERDGAHVNLETIGGGLFLTPAVARAVAADLLALADVIEGVAR